MRASFTIRFIRRHAADFVSEFLHSVRFDRRATWFVEVDGLLLPLTAFMRAVIGKLPHTYTYQGVALSAGFKVVRIRSWRKRYAILDHLRRMAGHR